MLRNLLLVVSLLTLGVQGAAFAKNANLTGKCVCKNKGNVITVYSETLCVASTHAGCTSVKNTCAGNNKAACTGLGGTNISGSSEMCTGYNNKC